MIMIMMIVLDVVARRFEMQASILCLLPTVDIHYVPK